MTALVGIILVVLLLQNLMLLGTGRVRACVRIAAAQGVILSLLPILAATGTPTGREIGLAFASIALKGLAFPWLLFRALRGTGVRRESEPLLGYSASIVAGMAMLGISLWIASRAPLPDPAASPLALPAALTTMLTGMLLIVTRRKALMQLLGYIVLENGIFAFGFAMEIRAGALVELGILIDALMAVLVMGVAIYHMHRAFDAIDVDQLSTLKDWNP